MTRQFNLSLVLLTLLLGATALVVGVASASFFHSSHDDARLPLEWKLAPRKSGPALGFFHQAGSSDFTLVQPSYSFLAINSEVDTPAGPVFISRDEPSAAPLPPGFFERSWKSIKSMFR